MKLEEHVKTQKERFKEKYVSSIKQTFHLYDIFVNPSDKEYRECLEQGDGIDEPYIRFIIDTVLEKVYVFSINLLHIYASKEINIPYKLSTQYIFGTAEIRNNEVFLISSYELESPNEYISKNDDIEKIMDDIVNTDFSWLSKYKWNVARIYKYLEHVYKLTYRRIK